MIPATRSVPKVPKSLYGDCLFTPAGHEHQHHGRNPSTPLPGQGRRSEGGRGSHHSAQVRPPGMGYLRILGPPRPNPPIMFGSSSLANALNTCPHTVGKDELILVLHRVAMIQTCARQCLLITISVHHNQLSADLLAKDDSDSDKRLSFNNKKII